MKCKECSFFESVGDGSCGSCHRFPPNSDGNDTKTIDEFPFVRKESWCGEYKKKGPK